jgi:hypothetical protein
MKTFKSFAELAEQLISTIPAVEAARYLGHREAAVIVQTEAQQELGHYQSAAGPFQAWQNLADTTLNGFDGPDGVHHPGKIELGYAPPDNPLVATGELHDHIEISYDSREAVIGVPDETVGSGVDGDEVRNIGDVAVYLEFGRKGMPPRSFLGRAAYVKRDEIVSALCLPVIHAIASVPYAPAKTQSSQPKDDIPF